MAFSGLRALGSFLAAAMVLRSVRSVVALAASFERETLRARALSATSGMKVTPCGFPPNALQPRLTKRMKSLNMHDASTVTMFISHAIRHRIRHGQLPAMIRLNPLAHDALQRDLDRLETNVEFTRNVDGSILTLYGVQIEQWRE